MDKGGRRILVFKIVFWLLYVVFLSVFLSVYMGLYPTCDYYGGFMTNPDAKGKACDCYGIKYFTIDQASDDGVTHSVCLGVWSEK